MSDVAVKAGIFGPKFVLLQILKYHQMIQYYNRIRLNLSTSTSQIINTKFSSFLQSTLFNIWIGLA